MKKYAFFLFIGLMSMGVFATLPFGVLGEEESTITGTVNELKMIEADDGEVYSIDKNAVGEEVKTHMGKKVEVTGSVEEGYGGALIITVRSYKLIE